MQMQLSTFTPPNAGQLFARLTEAEKLDIRRATPGRIEWFANNRFRVETGGDIEVMKEVHRQVTEEFTAYDNCGSFWKKVTWKF